MDFFNKIVDLFANENYGVGILALIIVVVGAIAFNLTKIVTFFDERKNIKIAKLTDALKCEYITESDKHHYQEALATEHFAIATGLRTEKEIRDLIINCHKSCEGRLSFVHFKRATPFIQIKDRKATVIITKFDYLSFVYNSITSICCFSIGIFMLAITFFLNFDGLILILKYLGIVFMMCSLGILLFFEALPIFSAKYVRKELDKQN
ncbi:hypothetical protein [Psychromonas sp.]|uniref:hypothetical protein n=1 Tax=Psychromonas sp. TaxID=1884585 RepID=UPI003A98207E